MATSDTTQQSVGSGQSCTTVMCLKISTMSNIQWQNASTCHYKCRLEAQDTRVMSSCWPWWKCLLPLLWSLIIIMCIPTSLVILSFFFFTPPMGLPLTTLSLNHMTGNGGKFIMPLSHDSYRGIYYSTQEVTHDQAHVQQFSRSIAHNLLCTDLIMDLVHLQLVDTSSFSCRVI